MCVCVCVARLLVVCSALKPRGASRVCWCALFGDKTVWLWQRASAAFSRRVHFATHTALRQLFMLASPRYTTPAATYTTCVVIMLKPRPHYEGVAWTIIIVLNKRNKHIEKAELKSRGSNSFYSQGL